MQNKKRLKKVDPQARNHPQSGRVLGSNGYIDPSFDEIHRLLSVCSVFHRLFEIVWHSLALSCIIEFKHLALSENGLLNGDGERGSDIIQVILLKLKNACAYLICQFQRGIY